MSKYRQVDWIFAIYEAIELKAIYFLTPANLEPYFETWEKKWHDSGGKDINNPKIPAKFVIEKGKLVFGQAWVSPASATRAKYKVLRKSTKDLF